jgi:hypothetical protein
LQCVCVGVFVPNIFFAAQLPMFVG